MADQDLAFTPASVLREWIASKRVSPVELTELYLQRIERLDPQLHAYLTVTHEVAIKQARAAEEAVMAGKPLGPLHGVPLSIKDLEVTKGIRTTLGSLVFKDTVPEVDSIVVERVRQAGAVILGKTNTPEFGLRGTTENRLGEACRNPWQPACTAGGSSGGAAAAVAAGLCALATGSDGGGSIRIPASFCGIYGLKPTQGRVPRYGGLGRPVVAQFSQSGPMARTVRDAALLLQVLAGPDPRDVSCLRQPPPDFLAALEGGVRGLRLGWSPDLGYAAVDPEVAQVAQQAAQVFAELGAQVDAVDVRLEEPFTPFWTIFSTNAYASYGHLLAEKGELLTSYARDALEFGARVSGADYARALLAVEQLRAQFATLMQTYDLLLTPTTAVPAFPVEQPPATIAGRQVNPLWGYLPFTFPVNMAGHPAASLPCGFSARGLPIGLHLIGRWGDEATVLRASAAFEAARPWAGQRPPLS
ncbi:MAG: amidase [Candidatus Tectimicrobiota bacterium]|nr:MAG: amidase [Candidatus Tectomicrobia bacterium]